MCSKLPSGETIKAHLATAFQDAPQQEQPIAPICHALFLWNLDSSILELTFKQREEAFMQKQINAPPKKMTPNSKQELELKAFVYQQAQEMEPYAKQLGSLVVFVEYTNKNKYRATFALNAEDMNFKFEAINKDPFEAVRHARLATQEQLNHIINALDDAGVLAQETTIPKDMLH